MADHPIAEAAPPFLAPRGVMEALEGEVGSDVAPESAVIDVPVKEPASNEFLDLLKGAMPPGDARPTFMTPEGYPMGLTENDSATYSSSGSACLDFFFQVVPSTVEDRLVRLLKEAWSEDALPALKLVFHLRGVRGTGKADKENFYSAAIWLQKHHPATLLKNVALIAEFGYFKDLLEVVLRLLEGPEEIQSKAQAKVDRKAVSQKRKQNFKKWKDFQESEEDEGDEKLSQGVPVKRFKQVSSGGYYQRKGSAARAAAEAGTLKAKEQRIADSLEADRAAKQQAASFRKGKKLALARRVAKFYFQDRKFRDLYLKIAKVFAERLTADLKALEENRLFDISLAAKWAPSLDSSYDLRLLLCYAIATQMFPKDACPEYKGLDDHNYYHVVREKLRKDVLVPLRKALELPEVYMSAQKWGEVKYSRVASVAMANYKGHFLKHDQARFTKQIEDAKAGKQKIAAGAVLPHEILRNAVSDDGLLGEVSELQWKRMVEDMKEKGLMSSCIAVCDVSGSMAGDPMDVCIALGILLSDLSEEPWKGHVITFSEDPAIHLVAGESLKEKCEFARKMDWGMNTNFQRVFDRMLTMAKLNKLVPEKMVRRLFVFSDMEFDQASVTPWETDYAATCRKFKSAGYDSPPEIVFWNLRDSKSTPVRKSQTGVALVSGFSKNLLKIFLASDGVIDPLAFMNLAIEGEEYSKVQVVD